MTFFIIFVFLVIVQRFAELLHARSNAEKMFSLGAVEYDSTGYRYIVFMHISFFISLALEFILLNKNTSPVFLILLVIFLLTQFLRYWAIRTLGIYWNTRIIVLKGSGLIRTGPYKYLKHPNYISVAIELAVIPLMFSCYFTAVFFTLINFIILKRRIKIESSALFIT